MLRGARGPGELYRYRSEQHALKLVRWGQLARELRRVARTQDFVAAAPLHVILVGVVPRTETRYGQRAERSVAIEGGAIVEALFLQAVGLDLGGVCIGSYDDAGMQAFVGTDAMPVALVTLGEPVR